jgi:hypothetical protein
MRALASKHASQAERQGRHTTTVIASQVRENSVLPSSVPVLQRNPACACGGGCPRCQRRGTIQTKLRIGRPGDRYEQEADRVADQVMRMPPPDIQRKPT